MTRRPALATTAVVVLACGALIVTLSTGIRAAFGVFLKPISLDLGLGREAFSLALAISTLLTGLGSPIVGALGDRFGATRLVIGGAVFYAGGLALASAVTNAAGLQATFGVIMGIGMCATAMGVVMGAVARALPPERRPLGFGIVMAGGSFGQFAMIPTAQALIGAADWRTASLVLAVAATLMILLALGLRGESAPAAKARATGAADWRSALAEATQHPGFRLLTASFFVCGFHVSFVQTHLVAFLSDRGLSATIAASALATVGLFNIFGSFGSGWLATRFPQRYVLSSIYIARALLFLPLVLLPVNAVGAMVFAALMGLLYLSTVAPTSGIVAQVFGPRHFSMLYGLVFASHQVGGALGAYLGGYLHDRTGSYDIVWTIAIALAVVAALLAMPIRDQPIPRPATTP